jgi:hypothetical protein
VTTVFTRTSLIAEWRWLFMQLQWLYEGFERKKKNATPQSVTLTA